MRKIGIGTFTTSSRMRELVNQVLDSNRLSYGDMSRRFEAEFARLHNSRFAVLSNSGTSSLHTALQALKELGGWEDGDEVVVPALTFVATVNVVIHNRLKPVLADVDPFTYNMDPGWLLEVITPRTRCVIPVHTFGQPANMTEIGDALDFHHETGRAKSIRVIEDSCEAMFSTHLGKPVGSWGDIGCFSTYVAHLITTGVGGLATTNSSMIARKMRSLVNHGRDGIYMSMDDGRGLTGDELHEVMTRRFNFESIGHSFRMTELEAAIGVAQLESYGEMMAARSRNADMLNEALFDLQHEGHVQLPTVERANTHAWMNYPIIVVSEESKWGLCDHLEARGIETREMLRLTDQPCYRGLWDPADYPVARMINNRGLYVGIHQDISADDISYMAETIRDYFGKYKR